MTRLTRFLCTTAAIITLSGTANAAVITAATIAPNSIVITEYLADPVGVSDSAGEYFEIFNTTNSAVDLANMIVKDDGSNAFTISDLTVAAHSFAIFSSADGAALGFSPDYVYGGSMSLTNTDDEIAFYRPDNTLITKVAYTDGDFFGDGIAHELMRFDPQTATLLFGPRMGNDFIAATAGLMLGNFGSPGFAGGTMIHATTVPVPAAAWMFGSALGILGWVRRRICRKPKTGINDASDTLRDNAGIICRAADTSEVPGESTPQYRGDIRHGCSSWPDAELLGRV